MEAGRVSEFWVRALNLQFHKESFPWDHMHVECENKGLTLLANISAPSELGIVSGEFLLYSCSVIPAALPPKTAGTDFSKRIFSLFPSSCGMVLWCWLKRGRAQPGGTWPVGWPTFWPLALFWGLARSMKMLRTSVTGCEGNVVKPSLRLGCDSSLFLWDCITVGVFVWNLIKVWIWSLCSLYFFIIDRDSEWCYVGEMGLAIVLTNLIFSVLAAAGDWGRLLILKGSSLGFLFFYFFIFVDANKASEIHNVQMFSVLQFYVINFVLFNIDRLNSF